MTRIENTFARLKSEKRKAFIPYITAGDPNLNVTLDLVLGLEKAGADIIELGVPFSDPIADGPVIQRATERALLKGVNLKQRPGTWRGYPQEIRNSACLVQLLQSPAEVRTGKAGGTGGKSGLRRNSGQ